MTRSPLIACAAIIALGTGGSAPSPQERETPPGEGVICMFAIMGAMAEIGARCLPEEAPAFQAEARRSAERLEAYVLANSDTTPAQIAEFKADQTGVGAPEAQLCQAESLEFYRHMAALDVAELSAAVDELVAVPGSPTWGTCL